MTVMAAWHDTAARIFSEPSATLVHSAPPHPGAQSHVHVSLLRTPSPALSGSARSGPLQRGALVHSSTHVQLSSLKGRPPGQPAAGGWHVSHWSPPKKVTPATRRASRRNAGSVTLTPPLQLHWHVAWSRAPPFSHSRSPLHSFVQRHVVLSNSNAPQSTNAAAVQA
jgi:hypothetical protein